jgi:AcrR family transcriptional regulator
MSARKVRKRSTRGRTETRSGWQAQKSATTRKRILDAAIHCIVEEGYARMTTTSIAERAGLSRGAMLHHFPSKIDIVRAGVEHLHAKRLAAFRKSITSQPSTADRVKASVVSYWQQVTHPLYTAFFELSVAARTDPELESILRPAQEAFDLEWRNTALELFPEWKSDPKAFDLALHLSRFLLEGMAVSFPTRHEQIERRLLEYLEERLHELSPLERRKRVRA